MLERFTHSGEDITHFFDGTSDLDVITFYETMPVPTLLKVRVIIFSIYKMLQGGGPVQVIG
jgi:hypothetical protein